MDYLDPKKERAQTIRLIIGYVLIGIAILIGTLILLYQAYGFGLDKDGEVIQNGLVFISSQPTDAQIFLNGSLYRDTTNAKLQLPEGQYKAEVRREGYTEWDRVITVSGGSVQHFSYPKLFPTQLKTANLKSYPAAPGLATQSPDRRWLVVQQSASPLSYDIYDLADPKKINENVLPVALPASLLTGAGSGAHNMTLTEWSTDNRHVMLIHTYSINGVAGKEYIMFDRQQPDESVNLTQTLSLPATAELQLHDKKFNQYYVYDTEAKTVGRTSLAAAGAVEPLLESVVAYKPYGRNMLLYVTTQGAPQGKVLSMLSDNGQVYRIREHGATGPFLIDLAEYNNSWYVVVGASGDNKVYVYKNPQRVRKVSSKSVLVPVQIMRMNAPNKLQFSSNTQFVMIQNGTNFVDYDAETDKGYRFTSKYPIDPPAATATWMDGQRLIYVSGGKVALFDYDNINGQTLVPASPLYLPFFDRDYENLYTLAPGANGAMVLTSTSMLTPADQ